MDDENTGDGEEDALREAMADIVEDGPGEAIGCGTAESEEDITHLAYARICKELLYIVLSQSHEAPINHSEEGP